MLYWLIIGWLVLLFLVWLFVAGARERTRQDKVFEKDNKKKDS